MKGLDVCLVKPKRVEKINKEKQFFQGGSASFVSYGGIKCG